MRRRRLREPGVAPNPAHLALAELERRWRGPFTLVTQNVDDLHERAGSSRVVHMHGELTKARCIACATIVSATGNLEITTVCPGCTSVGGMRPDIVWFGEMPMQLDLIYRALERCQLFVAIGTSGQVYPAAGFVEIARGVGAHTIELNLEPSAVSDLFTEHRYGRAGQIIPEFISEILSEARA
jgi:NAD-dependent protein deacetylase/lipoamidase